MYNENGPAKNTCTQEIDNKNNNIYKISINNDYRDPIVRCKIIFNCTSYCLSQQFGQNVEIRMVCEQWQANKMVATDEKQISIMSNIRKKIMPKKRLRLDSEEDED